MQVIWGGRNDTTYFRDLWAFDLQSLEWELWGVNSSVVPPPRDHLGGFYADGKLYIYGTHPHPSKPLFMTPPASVTYRACLFYLPLIHAVVLRHLCLHLVLTLMRVHACGWGGMCWLDFNAMHMHGECWMMRLKSGLNSAGGRGGATWKSSVAMGDLWAFDIQEQQWTQKKAKGMHSLPSFRNVSKSLSTSTNTHNFMLLSLGRFCIVGHLFVV